MNKQQFKYQLGNLKKKFNELAEQGIEIVYSATFTIDGKKQKLVDMADYQKFSLLNRFLEYENPTRVRIEWYDKNDTRNMIGVKDFDFETPEKAPEKPAFFGFGEAEINQIVDQRMAEKQRLMDHEELKDHVRELTSENQELQDKIEALENTNVQLEEELEKKKSIRYYAGMLGDILESFGIKREKIKKPLAELMGVDDEKQEPKQVTGQQKDASGIVEEEPDPEQQKRAEIINLIQQYLLSLPNITLAKVFQVFSAIEQSPFIADELMDYLKNRNPKNDE